MKRVAIITFGCKVNQYESACILNDFGLQEYQVVPFTQEAEVYIINTCTVTGRTDYKSRNGIRHALDQKQKNPAAKIIVTGCYAQLNRDRIKDMGDIDLIVDNNRKDQIWNFLRDEEERFTEDPTLFRVYSEQSTEKLFERARAFIKIQDGCDYFCSYCTVPLARGKPRSRRPEKVLSQIELLVENGYQEFVLTGINLGLYGRDLTGEGFSLAVILSRIEEIIGVKRIRLSSLEPQLITPELIEYFRISRKLAPHLHIPLQSGSDIILQKMNRPYKSAGFEQLLQQICQIIPGVAIGSDLILGFPGETEELFAETCSFVERLPLVYLHIFPFSRRPGTKASEMPDIPVSAIVKKRCAKIALIMEQKRQKYIKFLLANKFPLTGIMETKKGNYWTALSDHYIRIYYRNEEIKKGELVTAVAARELFTGIEVS